MRAAGEPKYNLPKLIKLAADGLFSFSALPLRLAMHLGLWVSAFAFLGAVFTLVQKLFSAQFAKIGLAPSAGFPTIVISILFLGGVRLICLGILGEYIGRIYEEVKGRPLWILRDSAGIVPPEKKRFLALEKFPAPEKTVPALLPDRRLRRNSLWDAGVTERGAGLV